MLLTRLYWLRCFCLLFYPPPFIYLMLIGDVVFASALHILGQRGIQSFLVLLLPYAIVSLMGEGFFPTSEALMRTAVVEDSAHINDNLDCQNKENSRPMLE
ncbi:hypothetical protein SLEP1_g32445 [Rubroshorea leprosula]|uniref:Uncharacterized protein n=1 Tax=Rubroshorea leprosula TaxID=152421 RepID=A0AAV5KDB5_9ROSI|nr:hypothetical protein SLEP1_g32445 [Rubroshorea leprosula]